MTFSNSNVSDDDKDLLDQLEHLRLKCDTLTHASLASTSRMVHLCEEGQAVGTRTLDDLESQGEHLDRVERCLGRIGDDMTDAERNIAKMEAGFAWRPWRKLAVKRRLLKWRTSDRSSSLDSCSSKEDSGDSSLNSSTSSYSSSSSYSSKSKKSQEGSFSKDSSMNNNSSSVNHNSKKSQDGSLNSSSSGSKRSQDGNKGPPPCRARSEELEMEENLEVVGDLLGNLKRVAEAMSGEVVSQNERIRRIESGTELLNGEIAEASRRTNKLLG